MNRYRCRSRQKKHKIAMSPLLYSGILLIRLHNRAAGPKPRFCFLHEALTTIGKDCDSAGQKASACRWREPKPTLNPGLSRGRRCARTTTETRHGLKSRTQAERADHHRRL